MIATGINALDRAQARSAQKRALHLAYDTPFRILTLRNSVI
jgi:hypothetical protein